MTCYGIACINFKNNFALYGNYLKDGVELTSIQDIIKETGTSKTIIKCTIGNL